MKDGVLRNCLPEETEDKEKEKSGIKEAYKIDGCNEYIHAYKVCFMVFLLYFTLGRIWERHVRSSR